MKKNLLTLFLGLCIGTGSAAPITVGDPSFEGNTLASGGWSNDLSPEWSETGGRNNGNGFEEYVNGFSAQGTDHLGLNTGHSVWNDLGETYQADTIYTLTVAAGNRAGQTSAGNLSEYSLRSSTGTIYASANQDASLFGAGSFTDAPDLILDTSVTTAAVGQTIRVHLFAGGGGRTHFDNIRLDAVAAEPSGAAQLSNLAASTITSSGASLRGIVTSIGDAAPSITIYYGTTDAGVNAGAWDSSTSLPGTHSGNFSATVSGLSPGGNYFFSARATNSSGDSWATPSQSFETLANAPSITQSAAANVTASSAQLSATITNNGGDTPNVTIYYGTTDGGTTGGNWTSSASLGAVTSSASTTISSLSPSTNYFFRALATNSGGSSWATGSGNFSTTTVTSPTIENRSPGTLTSTSAALRGEVTDIGGEQPTVTIFFGTSDGGMTPGSWDDSIAVGNESGNFSRFVSGLSPSTTYFYTCRAVNAGGTNWAGSSISFDTPAEVASQVVINEIHYDPLDETSDEEFIELHNPGTSPIDLSGWQLTDAVEFIIPGGTTLDAGGYLVIAQNPATITSVYGSSALGPWTGSLRNDGEEIDLRNASGTLQDQVNYDAGFPWPTGPRGSGSSMELINATLDNDLGASWRASGTAASPGGGNETTFIAEADSAWHYRKGTSEASSPVTDWRTTTFTEDATWLIGETPMGFGDGDDTTVLSDMRGSYSSVYLRHEFTINPLEIPQQLKLRIYVDDGAVVWINGTEVKRVHVADGQLDFNDTGQNHEAEWEELTIAGAGAFLIGGTNVIAVHALNGTLSSSDFSIDVSLESDSGGPGGNSAPTPGSFNSSYSNLTPPAIRQVDHSPEQPTSADAVTITAKITDPDGVGLVTLEYQTVDPGSYIRITDSAFDSSWTSVTMLDDGTAGDLAAGDSIYTVVLPASLQQHRRLMRYRINFEDNAGTSDTVPYADDEQPNFAYFTYDGVPGWSGSFEPGSTVENFPSTVMDDLPTYQLIANGTDVTNSQYNGGSDGIHQSGTLVYDGKVYDHINFENRGEASTYVSGKNKWRLHFNRTRRFQGRDNWGKKNPSKTNKLSINACASPWAAVNRGMAGLDEAVSFRLYELAGLPSPRTNYFSFRIIDDSVETDPSDQYKGDLWGLYLAVEQPNGSFLNDRDLTDGNVFKIEGGSGDKKEQGDTQVTDSSDWNAFYSASNSTNTESWWRENLDMPSYYSMRGINRLTGNVDLRTGSNHYFYHEPDPNDPYDSSKGLWRIIPWDLDMMYIAETHQSGGVIRQKNAFNHAQLELEKQNRCRELLDLICSDSSTSEGQIGQLIDEYAQIVNPTGQAQTWADIDAFMWNYHTRTRGTPGNASGQSNHKGNFYASPFNDSRSGGTYIRTLISEDHEGFVNHLINYTTDTFTGGNWTPGNGVPVGYGYEYLKFEAEDSNIPNKPTLAYTGAAGFPIDQLSFSSGSFSDPNGSNTFGKMRWRIAKILAPGLTGYEAGTPRTYEVETVAKSPDFAVFTSEYLFPADSAEPGVTYRVRVQHEDSSGRTSHWSEAVEFVTGTPTINLWQDNLVISEVMYNPPQPNAAEAMISADNDSFEFIELTNISTTLTLDLSELDFTEGITFDFANASLTALAPGASVLLVKNITAFEARYGTGLPVIGTYPNSLSNGGEQVMLSFAVNTPIIDFTYGTIAPWPTTPDGGGTSMVLVDPSSGPDHALPASWVSGSIIGGTPGAPEPIGTSYATWLSGHFSPAQLADPAISGENADPDGDSLSNLLEYAFLTDPLAVNPGGASISTGFTDISGETYLTLTYPQRTPAGDLSYLPQIGEDLQGWDDGPTHLVETSNIDQGNGSAMITMRSAVPVSGRDRQFVRVKITLAAP
ncbi:lamin tail domain-containing protein [bacterium]|nr:lamin tail domain-containing protein [bacterium]